jgi:hypothetical protein
MERNEGAPIAGKFEQALAAAAAEASLNGRTAGIGLSSPAERRLALCARKDLSISRSCAASARCEEAAARAAHEAKKLPQAFASEDEGRVGRVGRE